MRSPLYLDIAQADRVGVDGSALRVVTHAQAEVFFPLRRVSRVVVTGKVEWETAALLACLEYGVPVAFRGRDGRLLGHCLSDRSSTVSLENLLHAGADSAQGDALYQQWRAHEENRWVVRMGKACGLRLRVTTAQAVLPGLESLLQQRLPCPFALFRAQLEAPIASHVAEVLAMYGFSDNIHLPLTRRVHVSRDVGRLLWLEACWWVARGSVPELGERGLRYAVVQFYESHQAHFEERARVALNRLWRLLKHAEAD